MNKRPMYRVRRMPSKNQHEIGAAEAPAIPDHATKIPPVQTLAAPAVSAVSNVASNLNPDTRKSDINEIKKLLDSISVEDLEKVKGKGIQQRHGKKALFNFFNLKFAIDDIVLIGLIFLLLFERCEDDLLIVGLVFLLITGWE